MVRDVKCNHLYTLSLSAGKCCLHHAVVLPKHPRPVDELGVVAAGTGEIVCA